MKARRHYALICLLIVTLLLAMMLFSTAVGAVRIPLTQVLAALTPDHGDAPDSVRRIVLELRLPRTLLAAITGAGLAMVGALLQTTTRNDLADPFLFGLSSGASAGAVLVITRFGEWFGAFTLPVAAFGGGICSALAVMLLFFLRQGRQAEHLVICGLAISFLFGALTSYLAFSGDQRAASSVLFWSLGGLGLARWENLPVALSSLALLVGLVLVRWRALDSLLAGEQTAASLGVHVNRLRVDVFLCCALATALLVSLTGVIGFVGLMVPHLCRPLAGARHRRLIPLCGLLGAALLCGGDTLSRVLLPSQELPVGIVTAGLGGVFVIALLAKR
ncbi:FecCD family ABC transporter permease [Dickeya solani]|uniref:Iron(III) ABC transporter permease protein n=1 Tax=Dickeya solani D s0432-1 TaxID=1231725 RepID=A0AAV3KG54_9GAMM|nr:iron ABC transporter permease [Dickeya solani]ANE75933.1 ABC transporter permease [Dickeya solani IPO 2222]AUC43451.1 ABC transporter (iron.B12.siderophore.hemin), permease component [Dickeya solani RNS 08.23.3.1.A]AUH08657.1 ABC transporter permease [Dickeya solani D s0432-1]AUH12648.1 ABC transporter permease [Dickeya solani]AYQ46368.1 Iron-uptake system permease protein FeuC [Dickeya solani]